MYCLFCVVASRNSSSQIGISMHGSICTQELRIISAKQSVPIYTIDDWMNCKHVRKWIMHECVCIELNVITGRCCWRLLCCLMGLIYLSPGSPRSEWILTRPARWRMRIYVCMLFDKVPKIQSMNVAINLARSIWFFFSRYIIDRVKKDHPSNPYST